MNDGAVIYNRRPSLDPIDAAWAKSARKKVWNSNPGCRQLPDVPGEEEPPSIFRVSDNMREADPKAYDPAAVFLGPFHRVDPHRPSVAHVMERHKRSCVLFLVSRHGSRRRAREALDDCLAAMKKLEGRARNCYSGDISEHVSSSDEFSEMLLLDGCFVLYFLLRQMEKTGTLEVVVPENSEIAPMEKERDGDLASGDEEEEDNDIVLLDSPLDRERLSVGGMWVWIIVKYDLMKLENQIPFFIIQTLFDLLRIPQEAGIDLVDIALQFFGSLNPHRTGPVEEKRCSHEIRHLLHLYHLSLRPTLHKTQHHMKEVIPSSRIQQQWIPCATELQESGVVFRPKADASSFLDVTFARGVMEIPTLNVCQYSNSMFRNLIAFEQCYPVQPYVTNYALLMCCIMRGGIKDVRFLHQNGILLNRHSSGKEAANFFGQMCRHVHYGFQCNYLGRLFDDVTTYSENRWNRWRASLVREYFGNPWVITSVAAAFLLIVLTVLMTFFAAYSYFSPPS